MKPCVSGAFAVTGVCLSAALAIIRICVGAYCIRPRQWKGVRYLPGVPIARLGRMQYALNEQ